MESYKSDEKFNNFPGYQMLIKMNKATGQK